MKPTPLRTLALALSLAAAACQSGGSAIA